MIKMIGFACGLLVFIVVVIIFYVQLERRVVFLEGMHAQYMNFKVVK